uniref:Chloride channel protein n=1 Tax=Spongospora subterranea TaxID=70186 RepID=A0A0H5R789_9EUKA|eukprot:CRZ09686.1 hypothetical protein [Spongospora subterranea]
MTMSSSNSDQASIPLLSPRRSNPVFRSIVSHFKTEVQSPHLFDSFDFEIPNSLVRTAYTRNRSLSDRRNEKLWRWILTFVIAAAIAIIAFAIGKTINMLERWKYGTIESAMLNSDNTFVVIGLYVSISTLLSAVSAAVIAFYEPVAGGSGIPEIKCILNGVKIPRAVRLKTLFSKSIGIVFGVASGLPIGREGPMIHIGAICGAGLSQGKSSTLGLDTKLNLFRPFRNDREKRDFIACGTAAGVACAFGAPLGGVLFAIEESSSFWSTSLTLRAFFTALSSAFILNVLSISGQGIPAGSAFAFGLIPSFSSNTCIYRLKEVPIFIAMGICGGLFGAGFNHCNGMLCKWRYEKLKAPILRFLEVLLFSSVAALLAISIPLFRPDCIAADSSGASRIQFSCQPGQYSLTGTIFFSPAESVVKILFHSEEHFGLFNMILFMVVTYILSCMTYGISVPSGLFVPNLLAGAAFGRIVGENLNSLGIFGDVNSGIYALIGAASFLGGMARMTISLTVILIEATGNIQYGLPVMLALVFSKWAGDFFNDNLYDIHIHLKHLSYLPSKPLVVAEYLQASDVMEPELVTVSEICRVRDVFRIVFEHPHNCYPVVESDTPNSVDYRGSISRSYLIIILINRDFHRLRPTHATPHRLDFLHFENSYPRYPNIEQVKLVGDELDLWINLTPYMNPSPYAVQENSPVVHAFDLFRTMGLRHLWVVNRQNQIAGMITRRNLSGIYMRKKVDTLLRAETQRSYLHAYKQVPISWAQINVHQDVDSENSKQESEDSHSNA